MQTAGGTSPRRRLLIAWAFLAPNFIGFAFFTAGPVLFSLWMAFTDWSLTKHNELTNRAPSFIGFENFRRLLWGDESRFFWTSFYNTAYLLIGIPIGIVGSLLVALMLNRPIGPQHAKSRWTAVMIAIALGVLAAGSAYVVVHPGPAPTHAQFDASVTQLDAEHAAKVTYQQVLDRHALDVRSANAVAALFLALGIITAIGLGGGVVVFRTIFYLPSLLAGIALFLLWKSLYKPTGGAINQALRPACDWLQSMVSASPPALWYALGIGLWIIAGLGGAALLFVAARKRSEGDFASISLVGSTLAILALAATAMGLGWTLCQLPRHALFPTGYESFTAQQATTLRIELIAENLGLDEV